MIVPAAQGDRVIGWRRWCERRGKGGREGEGEGEREREGEGEREEEREQEAMVVRRWEERRENTPVTMASHLLK